MRKYREELKKIKFSNGGKYKLNGITYDFSNTCTVDYWLLSIFLVVSTSKTAQDRIEKSSINQNLYFVFNEIKNCIFDNNWNKARLVWTNFSGFNGKQIDGRFYYDYFGTLSAAFVEKMNDNQLFTFNYKCKLNCTFNGKEMTESSNFFSLK